VKEFDLSEMVKGWFIGDFSPSVVRTKEFEVAVKYYKKGDCESFHHHRVATEITVIASGRVQMNNVTYSEGNIILISPNESTNFSAIDDAITVVVKFPSVQNDKFSVGE